MVLPPLSTVRAGGKGATEAQLLLYFCAEAGKIGITEFVTFLKCKIVTKTSITVNFICINWIK